MFFFFYYILPLSVLSSLLAFIISIWSKYNIMVCYYASLLNSAFENIMLIEHYIGFGGSKYTMEIGNH